MRRASRGRRIGLARRFGTVGLLGLLAACGSTPLQPQPPLRMQALELEGDGARRYARGEWELAQRDFAAAERGFASIDDSAGRARNRMHLARVDLARGQPQAAFDRVHELAASSLDARLIEIQALLALRRDARPALEAARQLCSEDCAPRPGIDLLAARAALATGHPDAAAALAESALKTLRERDEPIETANALRILGAARLASDRAIAAQAAAEQALGIDRELALPAKLAADWLLIGDIRRALKVSPGGTAADAYRRALEITEAAGAAGSEEVRNAAKAALDSERIQ